MVAVISFLGHKESPLLTIDLKKTVWGCRDKARATASLSAQHSGEAWPCSEVAAAPAVAGSIATSAGEAQEVGGLGGALDSLKSSQTPLSQFLGPPHLPQRLAEARV